MEIKPPQPYTARPVRMDDAQATVDLLNAYSQALLGINQETVDSTLHWWKSEGFDIETDTQLVLTPTGQAVAYIEFVDMAEPHVHLNSWG